MRDQSLSKVAVLIFDPIPASRELTQDALVALGVRDLELGNSLDETRSLLGRPTYDLLILDATDDDGRVCGTIGELRHGRLGGNPFIVVLATMSNQSPELARKLVDSGVDGIVHQPISAGLLQTRIRQQVYARKPFVVTASYIGPDRRGDQRKEGGAVRIPVPNSLREKLVGTTSDTMIADAIAKAREVVSAQRVAQAASKIGVYCTLILEASENELAGQRDIAAMKSTIADLAQWASPEQFSVVLLHSKTLAMLAEQADGRQIRGRLDRIAVEARAIQRKLDPRKDEDGLKTEIAEAARRLAAHRAMEAASLAARQGERRA
jgi:CheY-like chemotaxis protein